MEAFKLDGPVTVEAFERVSAELDVSHGELAQMWMLFDMDRLTKTMEVEERCYVSTEHIEEFREFVKGQLTRRRQSANANANARERRIDDNVDARGTARRRTMHYGGGFGSTRGRSASRTRTSSRTTTSRGSSGRYSAAAERDRQRRDDDSFIRGFIRGVFFGFILGFLSRRALSAST